MPAGFFSDNPLPARYLALACPFISKKNVETFYSDVEIRAQKKPTIKSAFSTMQRIGCTIPGVYLSVPL
jgi:hypothetical protein